MKIGIEIGDRSYQYIDFTHLEKGNPGIGGISYQLLLLGYTLTKYYSEKYEVTYFHYSDTNIFPENIDNVICNDDIDMIKRASDLSIDALIVNCNKSPKWYFELSKLKLRIIVREGCYFDKSEIDCIRNTPQVVRIINVSAEEYDFYIDDDIIDRMICVENMMCFDDSDTELSSVRENIRSDLAISNHTVAYIGSIVPQKGFLRLAKVWPKVLQKIPDAHLKVIGSGQLYMSNQKLGKYGIAEENYENSFMNYLTDDKGAVLPSVTFCGLVKNGYNEVLKDVSVGVVNPIALTETFCTSAIDFASYGIPVVTCGKHGLLSTVINKKTGLTFLTDWKFINNLVKLLTDKELNNKLGQNAYAFSRQFDCRKMVTIWDKHLQDLNEGKNCKHRKINGNLHNDGKWLKLINAFLRRKLGLRFLPSSIDYQAFAMKMGHFAMRNIRKIVK